MNPYDYNRKALQARNQSRLWVGGVVLVVLLAATGYAMASGGHTVPTPVAGSGHFHVDSECPVRWIWEWMAG